MAAAGQKRVVGTPAPRVEGEQKVSGGAVYALDVVLPGMLWAKVLRSPLPHARIKKIDTARARDLPGVRAVLTGEDLSGAKIGKKIVDMPLLAEDVVRFGGERVAAIAADTEEIAAEAIELIDVDYKKRRPPSDPLEAMPTLAP